MYIVTAKTKQAHPQSHFHVVIGHERQGSTFSLRTIFLGFDPEVNELCTEPVNSRKLTWSFLTLSSDYFYVKGEFCGVIF